MKVQGRGTNEPNSFHSILENIQSGLMLFMAFASVNRVLTLHSETFGDWTRLLTVWSVILTVFPLQSSKIQKKGQDCYGRSAMTFY